MESYSSLTFVLGSVVVTSTLSLCYYLGYFKSIEDWINVRRQHVKMLVTLTNKIQNDILNPKTSSFSVNDTDLSASILYERMGQKCFVSIPFDKSNVFHMIQYKAELLRENKTALNITQEPGIPYMVCAHDLGGHTIRVTNQDSGVHYDYGLNVRPMYAKEVMSEE